MTAPLPRGVPPIVAVERYGSAMARFALSALRQSVPARPDAPRFLIYVTPWYRQAAGWFGIALGTALAVRAGAQVSFLVNDMPYPAIHPDELSEIAAFDGFCREFEALFPFHRLGAFAQMPDAARKDLLAGVVDEALSYDLRHRTGIGTLAARQAASFARTARTPLLHLAVALDGFLAQARCDVLLCPGGVANGSFVPRRLAELHGLRFASADSAFGALLIGVHGIAAHAEENAETHAFLASLAEPLRQIAPARGHAALARKMQAAVASAAEAPPCDLLMPLGYDYDTAALGIGSLYRTQDDWLRDTLRFVRERFPETRMIVRQHPHEAKFPCAENLALLAELEAAAIPNLRITRVDEKVPVYALLNQVKAVVACQSTVVLEAQMLGVPAISARDKYFVHAGIISRPADRDAYYDWLASRLRGTKTVVGQPARDAAATMYFILEECMTELTRFTPHAADLWSWLHADPVADLSAPGMSDLLRAFVADVPITTIKARRILGLPALPEGVGDPLADNDPK